MNNRKIIAIRSPNQFVHPEKETFETYYVLVDDRVYIRALIEAIMRWKPTKTLIILDQRTEGTTFTIENVNALLNLNVKKIIIESSVIDQSSLFKSLASDNGIQCDKQSKVLSNNLIFERRLFFTKTPKEKRQTDKELVAGSIRKILLKKPYVGDFLQLQIEKETLFGLGYQFPTDGRSIQAFGFKNEKRYKIFVGVSAIILILSTLTKFGVKCRNVATFHAKFGKQIFNNSLLLFSNSKTNFMFGIDNDSLFNTDFVTFYACVEDRINEEAKKLLLKWHAAQEICLFDAFPNDGTDIEVNENDAITAIDEDVIYIGIDEIDKEDVKEKINRKIPETQFTVELITALLDSVALKKFELISIHDLSMLSMSLRDKKSMIGEWNIDIGYEVATNELKYNKILLTRSDLSGIIQRNLVLEKKPNRRFLSRMRR